MPPLLHHRPWLLLPLLVLLSLVVILAGICVGSRGWEWPFDQGISIYPSKYQQSEQDTPTQQATLHSPHDNLDSHHSHSAPIGHTATPPTPAPEHPADPTDPADHDAWADAAITTGDTPIAATAPLTPAEPPAPLAPSGNSSDISIQQVIVWDIRLPRTLGAWLAGALLGLAGAIAQGLFRNPLADPYLLGSASGASLAVALAMWALSGTPAAASLMAKLGITGAAFAGAALAVALTLALARGVQHTMRLLLAGVVAGVVLGAMTSLVLLMRPDVYQSMQSFLMGSTAFVGWSACLLLLSALLVTLLLAWLLAAALDALALGEWTAHTLGLPLAHMRLGLVLALALATGTAVAQTGLIAFVGLAAPHLVRGCVQVRHGLLLVLSACMGGLLLCSADVLARWIWAPQELPTGVLTAIMGGCYLLWLMHRGRTTAQGG